MHIPTFVTSVSPLRASHPQLESFSSCWVATNTRWGRVPMVRRPPCGANTVMKAALSRGQETALTVASVCTLPVVAYSEFALLVTGCGLPPGPNGLYGAVEGISYLVLVTVIGLSAWLKVKTGSGLPAGPGGLLGAMEGFAYLLLITGLVDAAYIIYAYGSLPSAVPTEGSRCFVP